MVTRVTLKDAMIEAMRTVLDKYHSLPDMSNALLHNDICIAVDAVMDAAYERCVKAQDEDEFLDQVCDMSEGDSEEEDPPEMKDDVYTYVSDFGTDSECEPDN